MSLGIFYVGQTPGEPALVTVLSPDGTPRDLTGYDADGKMYSPDGTDNSAGSTTTITDAEAGIIRFDFPVPSGFDVPGTYVLQFELTTADPDVLDFTTTVEFDVHDDLPTDASDLVVGSDDVFRKTNIAVGTDDIRRAQEEIGIFLGVNIAAAWDTMTETSQYWVGTAICHQSTFTPGLSANSIGAKKVRAGAVEVTYNDSGTTTESALLHPMARICLQRISANSFYANPFIGDPYRTPYRPMWTTVSV